MTVFISCEKEKIYDVQDIRNDSPALPSQTETPLTAEDSVVINKMPYYYNFLKTMKENGYYFCDFRTYMKLDTSLLPSKVLVIRHDIHSRDVKWAYIAFQIEQIVIGSGQSTFYVLLNDPCELPQGTQIQKAYMGLIRHLDSNHVDIQPHISPIDLYINSRHPLWEKYSYDTLKLLFERNYFWGMYGKGKKVNVRGEDVFNINDINREIRTLLIRYNKEWTKQTGLKVQGYASHGSATCMNRIINNAEILDQQILRNAGIFSYDTYNSTIFNVLTYLSDNSQPAWMKNPQIIPHGHYQFLMHPYLWSLLR
ncbi:MAG TPA: hypothetical protein VK179_10985 [Bacteroidales bacterium]|nr:hypothetical protein [Bacteroidales bacterium]